MRFRPERPPGRTPWSMLGVLVVVGAALAWRGTPSVASRPPLLVEVVGDVERPGLYALEEPTLTHLLERSGGPSGVRDASIPEGVRVRVQGESILLESPPDPLIVGLPVDPNTASAQALVAIPGIGEATAAAILESRAERPFRTAADLRRVRGLTSERLEGLLPFLDVGPLPVTDLNTATIEQLDRLPGVGRSLAERIVEMRLTRGGFRSPDDLLLVRGIGPATLDDLRPLVATP